MLYVNGWANDDTIFELDEDLFYQESRICVEPFTSSTFVNVNHLAQGPKPYFYDGPLDRHVVDYNRTKPWLTVTLGDL